MYCKGTGQCLITITKEVLIIENPLTGKAINLLPLLQLLERHYDGDVTKLAYQIDTEIQMLVELMPEEGDMVKIKNLIHRKYEHRDAFLQAKCTS